MRILAGQNGDVILRLSTEARMVPELSARWEGLRRGERFLNMSNRPLLTG